MDETSGESHVIVGQHHVTVDKINEQIVAPPAAIKVRSF